MPQAKNPINSLARQGELVQQKIYRRGAEYAEKRKWPKIYLCYLCASAVQQGLALASPTSCENRRFQLLKL
jgi:hypothetical protein